MAAVTLHGLPISTATTRVLACLFEKDVEFKLVNVDMGNGQHKTPEFLKLQPFGQVPAFQDGDLTLFESRAICRYICQKHPGRGNRNLMGRDPLERAFVEQWLEVEGQRYHPPIAELVVNLALANLMGLQPDQAAIDANAEKLDGVLDVYERRLGESRYLAGDEFTLADLNHLSYGQYLVGTEKGALLTARRNVGRWWDEISRRESWRKVMDLQQAPAA